MLVKIFFMEMKKKGLTLTKSVLLYIMGSVYLSIHWLMPPLIQSGRPVPELLILSGVKDCNGLRLMVQPAIHPIMS